MKRIAILGSTGSIGKNTLEVIKAHPTEFKVVALAAGNNIKELAGQVQEWKPELISLSSKSALDQIQSEIPNSVECFEGEEGLLRIIQNERIDLVVFATSGTWGLLPLLEAIRLKKQIALANKESLVMAGRIVTEAARKSGVELIPIDSEHNAIFQALEGHKKEDLLAVWLTCSGGPFRHCSLEELSSVTPAKALEHPKWSMGKKITVDSSTLMNKGLELIEAKWLFNLSSDTIRVVIHPEAIIHSMVEFIDGSILAQMGVPDMKGPIQYALGYPRRFSRTVERLNLLELGTLSFDTPDTRRFPCLDIAYQVAKRQDSDSTTMNAANDVAVEAFLRGKIQWVDIPRVLEDVLSHHKQIEKASLEQVLETDHWAREEAIRVIDLLKTKTVIA